MALAWMVVSGWARQVPFKELFAALFIFYPLFFNVTSVSPMYAYLVQPYMLIMVLAVIGLPGSERDGKYRSHGVAE